MSKDFPVSWEEMHRNAKALAWRLLDGGPWKGVIGIARGGLVPACIVARELDIRLVESFCISSYDHTEQREAKILNRLENVGDGTGWIVVDDLVDTGGTFRLARELFPRARYCSIYAKPAGEKETDTYITAISQDTWVHFPWDLESQYAVPLADTRK